MSCTVGIILNDIHHLICCHIDTESKLYGYTLNKLCVDVLQFIYKINCENGWNRFKNLSENIKHINLFEKNESGLSQLINMYNNNNTELYIDNSFILNRYCDYGYIINLDDMILEYYVGYQTKPQNGNRFGTKSIDSEYYPCRLCSIYDLASIDSDDIIEDIIENMDLLDGNEDKYENVSSIYRKYKLKKLCNTNATLVVQ